MVNKQADSFHGELWFFTQRSGKIIVAEISFMIDADFFISAHKVTEVKANSEEVNVSYADPENQACTHRIESLVSILKLSLVDA